MTAIADGDRAAQVALYSEFGGQIASTVRRELRRFSVTNVTAEDLDGLVIDSVMALAECAAAWRPERGALPGPGVLRHEARLGLGWRSCRSI